MRVLIAGWFSFEKMGVTAGDIFSKEVVCGWLRQAGIGYDVALIPSLSGGVDWRKVDPKAYSHALFVCGPLGKGEIVDKLFSRFSNCRIIGINLSMLEPLDNYNPFDILFERDSQKGARPDISFAASSSKIPVAGIILAPSQAEYGRRQRHGDVHGAIRNFITSHEISAVNIDTLLEGRNSSNLKTPNEIESLISKMDLVITTRLHGMVLALKNGVPAVVIDPIEGGAKVSRQAEVIGWPMVFKPETLSDKDLQIALDFCLTPEAKRKARECADNALEVIRDVKEELISFISDRRYAAPRL